MFIVQWGPLSLNGPLLLIITFGLGGWLAVWLSERSKPHAEAVTSTLLSASILWLVVWKGSLIFIDPMGMINHPISLLYFDGGILGRWLASVVSIAYVIFTLLRQKVSKAILVQSLLTYLIAGFAIFQTVALLFGQIRWTSPAFLLAIAIALIYTLFRIMNTRFVWQMVIITGGILMIAFTIAGQPAVPASTDLGERAPELQLQTTDGDTVLQSDVQGQWLVLNFWATWCPPCRAEMPSMQTLHERYAEERNEEESVRVIAVNLTATESKRGNAEAYMQENNFTLPLWLDTSGQTARAYQIRAYPTTVVLDPDGHIRARFEGAVHHSLLERTIHSLQAVDNR
jgi:peroxiredoxin